MFIKAIASVAFAALLLTGPAASVPSSSAREVPATVQTTEPTTQLPEAELTPQEAATIALEHAGLVEADTKMMRIKLEIDDGVLEYEVKFFSAEQKYEYSIHAVTGEILEWEAESWRHKARQEKKKDHEQSKPPVEDAVIAPALTAEEARAIALAHAGLTAEEVNFAPTELERERGALVYEVEFRVGNWEYSYEIHAETGEILEWEKEFDD